MKKAKNKCKDGHFTRFLMSDFLTESSERGFVEILNGVLQLPACHKGLYERLKTLLHIINTKCEIKEGQSFKEPKNHFNFQFCLREIQLDFKGVVNTHFRHVCRTIELLKRVTFKRDENPSTEKPKNLIESRRRSSFSSKVLNLFSLGKRHTKLRTQSFL